MDLVDREGHCLGKLRTWQLSSAVVCRPLPALVRWGGFSESDVPSGCPPTTVSCHRSPSARADPWTALRCSAGVLAGPPTHRCGSSRGHQAIWSLAVCLSDPVVQGVRAGAGGADGRPRGGGANPPPVHVRFQDVLGPQAFHETELAVAAPSAPLQCGETKTFTR